MVINAPSL